MTVVEKDQCDYRHYRHHHRHHQVQLSRQ